MDGNAKPDETTPPVTQPAAATAAPKQSDSSGPPLRVIRTFASDMAALHGAPPIAAQPIPQEKIHTPAPKQSLSEDVAQIRSQEPVVQAPPPMPAPKTPPPQVLKSLQQIEPPRIKLPPKP